MHIRQATRAVHALILAVSLLALVAVPALAAAPSPAWTKQFGSSAGDRAEDVAVDDANAIYVAGSTLGSITGWPSRGNQDAFVRKVKPDGKKAWTKQFGTATYDAAYAVAVDRSRNVYVAGYTYGSLSGSHKGQGDAFLRKIKPNGKKAWTRQFGTAKWDYVADIAIGPAGHVYLTGWIGEDVFVRKYKPNGAKVWHRRYVTSEPSRGYGIAVDRSGNIYFAGSVGQDAFVYKLRPDRSEHWYARIGTTAGEWAAAIAVDRPGNVYVVGRTGGTLGGTHLGGTDVFVRKYKSDGVRAWTRQFGTPVADYPTAVAVDRLGRIAISGTTFGSLQGTSLGGGDAFVRKYKADGKHAWTRQFGSAQYDTANGIAVDAGPRIIVAGTTDGSVTGWPPQGGSDAFVRKYQR